jgi:hypothetical protein
MGGFSQAKAVGDDVRSLWLKIWFVSRDLDSYEFGDGGGFGGRLSHGIFHRMAVMAVIKRLPKFGGRRVHRFRK